MQNYDSTRRTALKVLGLGLGGAVGTGVATGGEDDHRTKPGKDDRRPTPRDMDDIYLARLTSQEGVKTRARGVAAFHDRSDGLKFGLVVRNIDDVFMAHIHEGEPLGPIAVWLHHFMTQDEQLIEGTFTGIQDVGTITDEVIAEGRAPEAASRTVSDVVEHIESGEAYVNVHTEAHPGGELAGRIEPFTNQRALQGLLRSAALVE